MNGILEYNDQQRAVVRIDQEIVDYYYSLIPKAKYAKRQMYPAHITVVRIPPIEVIKNEEAWGKYEGEKISFIYNGEIKFESPYFFIEAWSERIGDIREELGLPRFRQSFTSYHITVGNVK